MMSISRLKLIFTIVCISGFALLANAQQVHFVYLQTENNQPFYVKVNKKVVSSSQTGYVIIPNMVDGDYEMVIGFPKNEFPEEKFKVTIDKKNEGFLVKNFGEKGWSLFNLQTLALIEKMEAPATVATVTKIQDDPFSKMLASVVKDSSLLQKIEPVVEKPVPVVAEKATDTVAEKTADTIAEKPDVAITETPYNPVSPVVEKPASPVLEILPDSNKAIISSVTKILSLKEKEGIEMIYVDKEEKNNDTIRIFMPFTEAQNTKEVQVAVVENKMPNIPSGVDTSRLTITPTIITAPPSDTAKTYPVAKDLHFEKRDVTERPAVITYDTSSTVIKSPEESKAVNKEKNEIIVLPRAATSSKVNSDCKAFATDSDFLKLRKKMAAENNNDDMVAVAKKVFRSACFSTEQIKNLSYLFLNDEGKYMFFDAAYAYTSDSDQYEDLGAQLTDPYYITRFKAMIHK